MGPRFLIEPISRIVMVDALMTSIECVAYGNPPPVYRMYRTTVYDNQTHVTSSLDTRYTLSNGKLQIDKPTESKDSGTYQCVAENQFGTVYSVPVSISFGTLGEFANVIRAPVVAKEHDSANIECLPPSFKPAVVYQWRKAMVDFVRPDLNPHLFISSNGKLYFSEVNLSDEGEYLCIVKLTSGNGAIMDSLQPPSRTSLPIRLRVNYADPKVWGPEISNDFINVFPNVPMRGQTILLECLAYGALPLTYSWRREGLPLPSKIYYTDHKRILHIPNAELEDGGNYVCHVARTSVAFTEKAFSLQIQCKSFEKPQSIPKYTHLDKSLPNFMSFRQMGEKMTKPYFVFPLRDQHVDIGSQLTWRCEARAVPPANYLWFKNGQVITVKQGEIEINQNVMIIKGLDQAKHNGMYQCAAENVHGTTFSSAQLRVLVWAYLLPCSCLMV
ncbi:hypothetical protein CHS0354_016571 [Potamilus streckersoni]|uniref:Ig-like domain-containing protein n=1 Tax=Potamilus streckersoni TaxID=2493646 RepID=A0AAE0TKP6_9BIVA|nr:hypothetical protein CHS0354_016571 [Potamilus streckersoni]